MENIKEKYSVLVKPMSLNKAYLTTKQGKRVKTQDYKDYEMELMFKLPPSGSLDFIRGGDIKLSLLVGLSNKRQDLDNVCKQILDIFQVKYSFDDCQVMEIHMRKEIVAKGSEFISFDIVNTDNI